MVQKKQDGDVLTATDFNFVLDFVQSSIDNHALFREKIARHDFIENLDELSYQGGFYDIFKDKGKIVSFINTDVVEDWEDNDLQGWTGELFGLSVQSNTVISGNYTGFFESNGTFYESRKPGFGDKIVDEIRYKIRIPVDVNEPRDQITTEIRNSNGDDLAEIEFEAGTNDILVFGSGNSVDTWSVDTTYNVVMKNIDYGSETFDLEINGTDYGNFNFSQSVSGVDKFVVRVSGGLSDKNNRCFIDDIEFDPVTRETSNVLISTLAEGDNEGKIKLAFNDETIDNFEDGNIQGWTGDTSFFSVISNDTISGGFSGKFELFNDTKTITKSFSKFSGSLKFKINFREIDLSIDEPEIFFENNNGNTFYKIKLVTSEFVNDDGDVILSGVNVDQTYSFKLVPDFNNNEMDVVVDGQTKKSDDPFVNAASGFQDMNITLITQFSSSNGIIILDDIIQRLGRNSSGFITEREDLSSGDDNFSNPPVSVTVNQDADIPADEDIQYIVKDVNGSGTDTTVTQSEVGTRVDISDFTGFLIEVKTKYTTSDGADTPTHRSQDFYFEEG